MTVSCESRNFLVCCMFCYLVSPFLDIFYSFPKKFTTTLEGPWLQLLNNVLKFQLHTQIKTSPAHEKCISNSPHAVLRSSKVERQGIELRCMEGSSSVPTNCGENEFVAYSCVDIQGAGSSWVGIRCAGIIRRAIELPCANSTTLVL
jgi:hypothetical protein